MKARVRYDDNRAMWIIEIQTTDGWDFCKGFKVRDITDYGASVNDTILQEIAKMQETGYQVTVVY